jgi:hypothetical protein
MTWFLVLLCAQAVISPSAIREYANIALVRVVDAKPSPWEPGPRRTKTRRIALELAIERSLKGAQSPPAQVRVDAEQVEPGPRVTAVPGAWSGKSIEPGSRYIVFANGDLAKIGRVVEASALPQIELALQAERQKWRLDQLAAKAPPEAVGVMLGEYVLARLDEVLYSDPERFSSLLSWLERPETPSAFRLQLASGIFPKVISDDPVPRAFWTRLAISGFRMAALPDSAALAEALVGTYLPNLLGVTGGISRKSATDLFAAFPGDRQTVSTVAARSPELSSWISGK